MDNFVYVLNNSPHNIKIGRWQPLSDVYWLQLRTVNFMNDHRIDVINKYYIIDVINKYHRAE